MFFDSEKNARDYIKMTADYVPGEIIQVLRRFLPDGSTLLELGMGPGKDLDILGTYYKATGSDAAHRDGHHDRRRRHAEAGSVRWKWKRIDVLTESTQTRC